jgi:hypothetical protein
MFILINCGDVNTDIVIKYQKLKVHGIVKYATLIFVISVIEIKITF